MGGHAACTVGVGAPAPASNSCLRRRTSGSGCAALWCHHRRVDAGCVFRVGVPAQLLPWPTVGWIPGSGYAASVSPPAGSVRCMNPNRHRAVEIRREALRNQVEGLEQWVAAGRSEPHVVDRLEHTRAELANLETHSP